MRGRADEDWLWAGAFHPLSPLATSGNALAAASDSGEQRLRPVPVVVQDAARRFVIAREMLSELSPVVNYVAEVEGHGLPLHALMSAADHTRYVRRWNRVKQHLDRIAAYLALHDYDHVRGMRPSHWHSTLTPARPSFPTQALYHVRSLQADAKMLAALSRRASRRISSHLDCLQVRGTHSLPCPLLPFLMRGMCLAVSSKTPGCTCSRWGPRCWPCWSQWASAASSPPASCTGSRPPRPCRRRGRREEWSVVHPLSLSEWAQSHPTFLPSPPYGYNSSLPSPLASSAKASASSPSTTGGTGSTSPFATRSRKSVVAATMSPSSLP